MEITCRTICLLVWAIVVSTTGELSGQQGNPRLKYGWQAGEKYGYEFEAEFEFKGGVEKTTGFAKFEVKANNVAKDLDGNSIELRAEGEATSTAFAVTPDGYLLTCAHCIEGAKIIHIAINGTTFKARLIEADYELDLAVIKIEANDLPTVSLGKKDNVELAQDVRAIGFPLSEMLGNSVKISRGSIAGFIEEAHETTYQLDVAVNPGNSGGPLVNENGAVIGIVNAKLNGQRISKVGFAVPIGSACQMLDRHKIQYDSAPKTKPLAGPELARQLTPAVFFVKTEIGPGGHSHLANFQFSVNGSMKQTATNQRNKQEITQSQAIVAADGHLMDSKRETTLPMLLGPICHMPFEVLPNYTTKRWSQVDTRLLSLPRSRPQVTRGRPGRDSLGPFYFGRDLGWGPGPWGFGMGPRGFPNAQRPPGPTEMRMAIARQKSEYEITERVGDLVTITCHRVLKTMGDQDEFCNLRVEDKSTLKFDTEKGVFVSKKLEGAVKLKWGDEQVTFPVQMSYRQVDLDDFLNPPSATNGQQDQPGSAVDGLSEQQLDVFIETEPAEYNVRELFAVLNRLSSWKDATERKQAVVDAIKSVIQADLPSEQTAIKKLAIEALLNWDPAGSTPFVIQAFEEAAAFSKRAWIVKLGQTRHPDAARILCHQLQTSRLRVASKLALIELGVAGEPAIIATLRQSATQPDVVRECLEVMAKTGTQRSLDTIEGLAESLEQHSKQAVQQSVNQIQNRIQTKR